MFSHCFSDARFLSTLSLRRATANIRLTLQRVLFLSTLSLRRATHPDGGVLAIMAISIHALLAESDLDKHDLGNFIPNFYPRSPCGERLWHSSPIWCASQISIHALLAESDHLPASFHPMSLDFYPRSPCGERPESLRPTAKWENISIHALLAESDIRSAFAAKNRIKFLSTLSLRRATAVWLYRHLLV